MTKEQGNAAPQLWNSWINWYYGTVTILDNKSWYQNNYSALIYSPWQLVLAYL